MSHTNTVLTTKRIPLSPTAVCAAILLVSINGLFFFKYGLRNIYVHHILMLFGAWTLMVFGIIRTFCWPWIKGRALKTAYVLLTLLMLLMVMLLHRLIPAESVQVDRWSALAGFDAYLWQGRFPYEAHTHLEGGYGSPFPIWQLIHLPFWLMGDVGGAMTFFLLLLSVTLVWSMGWYRALFFMLLLFVSPAFWYEVAVRSDLIYNMLFTFSLVMMFWKLGWGVRTHTWATALICGMMLSTRLAVAIPFLVFLFRDFWQAGLKRQIIFLGAGIGVFVLTFLPFMLWNADFMLHSEVSPIALQTRQGNPFEGLTVLAICIGLSWWWRNMSQYGFAAAVSLLFLVVQSMLIRMIENNFENTLFSPSYDITYYGMAIPFLLLSVIGCGMNRPETHETMTDTDPQSHADSESDKGCPESDLHTDMS
ncbi:MAG: hypothetical protein IJ680_01855 [Paludibacteraceae bacterium]|nr:hypothetical protein [Paludibacteraceae bacterium]